MNGNGIKLDGIDIIKFEKDIISLNKRYTQSNSVRKILNSFPYKIGQGFRVDDNGAYETYICCETCDFSEIKYHPNDSKYSIYKMQLYLFSGEDRYYDIELIYTFLYYDYPKRNDNITKYYIKKYYIRMDCSYYSCVDSVQYIFDNWYKFIA